MKAILLSAGRGSRLLPLTESRPKCLLPVQGTTLLGYQLDTLEAAGIRAAILARWPKFATAEAKSAAG